jgi:lycopene cyclase domain-containing protein
MTYFGFLARFLLIPMVLVGLLLWRDHRRGVATPAYLRNFPAWAAILLHIVIAVIYTTPWDNYLVATRVWWYDPDLVAGITLGWVPIEEYTFFILQTWLTGMWLLWLTRRLPPAQQWSPSGKLRLILTTLLTILWIPFVLFLIHGLEPATYISLILAWALPPIILQLAFGADILWRYRTLVLTTIAVPTIFLALADTLAIQIGIWSISPEQTTGFHLPGGLPLEEFLFFLVTNVLVGFGVTLFLAQESGARVPWFKESASVEGADA